MNTDTIQRIVSKISQRNAQAWDNSDGYEAICETKQNKTNRHLSNLLKYYTTVLITSIMLASHKIAWLYHILMFLLPTPTEYCSHGLDPNMQQLHKHRTFSILQFLLQKKIQVMEKHKRTTGQYWPNSRHDLSTIFPKDENQKGG